MKKHCHLLNVVYTFFIYRYENVLSFTLTARHIINHIPYAVINNQAPFYFLHPGLSFFITRFSGIWLCYLSA